MKVSDLQPNAVWRYFEEIMRLPRPSKLEGQISAYLANFGKEHGLETLTDSLGNVLIRKPAYPGYENAPMMCLQAHMDMVCEKNADKQFDFLKDPIVPIIDGDWLTADGTTLGADDGIGVAAILAILEASDIQHGPLEALFTVDEETGLTGAAGLSNNWLKSSILLNFDDEDEGEYCIGCAGGIDTTAHLNFSTEPVPAGYTFFRIAVSGLKGGHSGDDINKGLACANKLLTRILWDGEANYGLRLASIDGGNLRNAIAREASAVAALPTGKAETFAAKARQLADAMRFEFRSTEPGMEIAIEPTSAADRLIDSNTQNRLLNAHYACAHGVLAMSREIPNFVETSTNLASVKMDGNTITIATSQRSSVESAKHAAAQKIEATFRLAGASVSHGDGYPGWTPNPDSRVLKTAVQVYRDLYNKEPIVRAIHAGLECGLIGEKYPGMDMISYGPTLRGVHSPDERIEISTVQMFWNQTLAILKALK